MRRALSIIPEAISSWTTSTNAAVPGARLTKRKPTALPLSLRYLSGNKNAPFRLIAINTLRVGRAIIPKRSRTNSRRPRRNSTRPLAGQFLAYAVAVLNVLNLAGVKIF
jgi:hypothetical protein